MSRYELGKIRQSAVVMSYGPGAIIDFREPGTGAPVSVVSAGLETWESQARELGGGPGEMRRLTEYRLKAKLGVDYFRLPPIAPDRTGEDQEDSYIPLIGVRFPGWLTCPRCNTLKPTKRWAVDPGRASRYCAPCSEELPGDHKVHVVPVRFIVSCRNGHLDDFPWASWVHQGRENCGNRREFKLENRGPGLEGLVLMCPRCKARKSMGGIFRETALDDVTRCSGARPWLGDEHQEPCNKTPLTMQRGASNLYFPQMESALVIPPWSEDIVKAIGYRWEDLRNTESASDRRKYIETYLWNELDESIKAIGIEEFASIIENKLDQSRRADTGDLRWDEYRQFRLCGSTYTHVRGDFEVRAEPVPPGLDWLAQLLRVVSLREIRALTSFTRVEPPPGSRSPVRRQYLSRHKKKWLPAIEVKGEGIFLSLNEDRLAEWEVRPSVLARARRIMTFRESRTLNPTGTSEEPSARLGARYLLVHSLAHVLMKQLSLQCGYSTASLRERLYVGTDEQPMAGLLIYTATSDSDGTLGGLQREGRSEHFAALFMEAIRASEWCSSDPLCIQGLIAATESSSIAACHSCLLAPETSCEDYNRFLDRGMIVGLPAAREVGFFSELLENAGAR